MLLNDIKPDKMLNEYVRQYRIIDFSFPSSAIIPPKLYSPRPEQCLQFYPKDTETVTYPGTSAELKGKRVSCVGHHTILQKRQIGNEFLSVQVVFQPGALFRLTGIDMKHFSDQYLDATDIFGTAVDEVNEQLYEAGSYTGMIDVVEKFIRKLMRCAKTNRHVVDTAGASMLLEEDRFRLDAFLSQACLSHRQFDRKFHERYGISPKQFLRIIRFDKAYRMKNRLPHLDWLSVAMHTGYHDYQHLAKDYKEFTGYTPPQFFVLDNQAPERTFGDAEI